MENFIQITPFLQVHNLASALHFFQDILSFKVLRWSGYAYVYRETVGFRILERAEEPVDPGITHRFAYYVDVRNVDALYAELKPKLDTLPPEHVHGPADKGYGQRELLVVAPDGNLIAFGQSIFKMPGMRDETP